MTDEPDLDAAYALNTPQDSVRLYAKWAETYDTTFAETSDYLLHLVVARRHVDLGCSGPYLDVGAGTGLAGAALHELGARDIDGTDISPEMLHVAETKGVYRTLFPGDILTGLDVADRSYGSIISSGTFTHGHVGPTALDELMRLVAPGGRITISINAAHYESQGFADKFALLEPDISDLTLPQSAIYGARATGDHANDKAVIASWIKRA